MRQYEAISNLYIENVRNFVYDILMGGCRVLVIKAAFQIVLVAEKDGNTI